MYFKNLPNILYPFTINGQNQYVLLKDITANIRVIKEVLANITLYDEYDMADGETPEIVSEKFYGSPYYHWIIMLVNERFDYIEDFAMPYEKLYDYAVSKYGESGINAVHHYENTNGWVVSADVTPNFTVTNLMYEERLNEQKRRIKLIDKTLVNQIVKEFNKAFK